MELDEFDKLIESLVKRFGALDPNDSLSEQNLMDTIDDANPGNIQYYVKLLQDMGIIIETDWEDSESKYLPSGKRYTLGSEAMNFHIKRQEAKNQRFFTKVLIGLGLTQLLFILLQVLRII